MNKYFTGILNSWIALPANYTKFNVQGIKMISQSSTYTIDDEIRPLCNHGGWGKVSLWNNQMLRF